LFYLQRCGFDTFALRDDQDLPSAQRAFGTFSDSYQTTVNQSPLFRRRAAGAQLPSSGGSGIAAKASALAPVIDIAHAA
jgi:hypothetical protein